MLNQIYHITYQKPVITRDGMVKDLENMAEELLESGRLRLDTVTETNFVRFFIKDIGKHVAASPRELNEKNIIFTKRILAGMLYRSGDNPAFLEEKINRQINIFKKGFSNINQPSTELQLKIARLLVQSVHPSVMKLLLWERTEFFVTFGYSVGEVMDVVSWKENGDSSGLQATDGRDAAVFVSAAGDPFAETSKEHPEYGDGVPAMSRMMVIVAQEMGHFSDIKRDQNGRQIGRYSANFSATVANPAVAKSRIEDIKNCKTILAILNKSHLFNVMLETEQILIFRRKHKVKKLSMPFIKLYYNTLKLFFSIEMKRKGYDLHKIISTSVTEVATYLKMAIEDTLVNLEPKAGYERNSAHEQEAIYCVEAMARVPQQVIKLGKKMTSILMPNLYQIYYFKIIPGCIKALQRMSGKRYSFDGKTIIKISVFKKFYEIIMMKLFKSKKI